MTAGPDHIDELGHVNNAVWVQWIQELAVAHWNAVAAPEHVAAYIWVVTRHEIDYRKPAHEGETVHGRTWIEQPPRGARFERLVEFSDGDGNVHVRAETIWAMVDHRTLKPLRIPPEVAAPFLRES